MNLVTAQTSLARLAAWYASHCNGDWEHQHGFDLFTVDNPGIGLRVDLRGTNLASKPFADVKQNLESDTAWVHCRVTESLQFEGCGSPEMIEEVIEVFLRWATEDD